MCKISAKKMLNSVVVGAHQSFQFFRQNTWLLKKQYRFVKVFVWNSALLN